MQIEQHVPASLEMLHLIATEYQDLPIDKVLIVGGTDQLDGHLGEYVPDTKSVIIDLKACMRNQWWMEKGMSYVPNVRCNLIYTIFHEGIHAEQYSELGEDINLMPVDELERDAHIRALEQCIDWFHENPVIPPIEEFGWIGSEMKRLFNGLYGKNSELVDEELALFGTAASANPGRLAAKTGLIRGDAYRTMIDRFEEGDIGVVVNSTPYLKPDDFLEVVADRPRR